MRPRASVPVAIALGSGWIGFACTLDLPNPDIFSKGTVVGTSSGEASGDGGGRGGGGGSVRLPDGGEAPDDGGSSGFDPATDGAPPAVASACGGNGATGDSSTLYRTDTGVAIETCRAGCEWTNDRTDHCRTTARCPAGAGLYCGGNGVTGATDVLFRCGNGKIVPESRCTAGCDRRPAGTSDRCN